VRYLNPELWGGSDHFLPQWLNQNSATEAGSDAIRWSKSHEEWCPDMTGSKAGLFLLTTPVGTTGHHSVLSEFPRQFGDSFCFLGFSSSCSSFCSCNARKTLLHCPPFGGPGWVARELMQMALGHCWYLQTGRALITIELCCSVSLVWQWKGMR
jgi:hypothetical protein